jgi:hypothetical protein
MDNLIAPEDCHADMSGCSGSVPEHIEAVAAASGHLQVR